MSAALFNGWSPLVEHLDDTVTASAAARLHHLLDAPGKPPTDGDHLPPLWHWLAFLPDVRQSELGPDGHPKLGGFLPPVALPRRMFVGGRVQFLRSVGVGTPLHRTGTVIRVEPKLGRSGSLVLVTVRFEISDTSGPSIVEEQDIVYREAAKPAATPPAEADAPDILAWPWKLDLNIDPTFLFRFSSLTYNAHRIHYDREWATIREGYPGLVVHGPLQAIGLAELCRRYLPTDRLRGIDFRSSRPAFDDGPLRLRGRLNEASEHLELTALTSHGAVATTATGHLSIRS